LNGASSVLGKVGRGRGMWWVVVGSSRSGGNGIPMADDLTRKERVNPKRVRAMNMTLQSSIKDRILAAQKVVVDEFAGLQKAEIGEGQLIGPELVQETTEKILQIKDRLKAARDHLKSYVDKRRKPLEFSVGDYVLLKVSPWKGVACLVAYQLDLLEELNGVHDKFHVSNLKKCLVDPTMQVPLDEIQVDVKLNFVEEAVEILDREFKKLKHSRIAIVKILYRVDGGDFVENYDDLWFIVINNPFWKVLLCYLYSGWFAQ
nr:putative reverse transcriptase domain-containing protein [Tanacetum cinerariifolium]